MLQHIHLSLLRAFEAAGRTGSFRTAAEELSLTPSAVSHAIRKLEQALGASLFERDGRAVRLSAEGEALMRHVGRAFEELRRGVEMVSTRGTQMLRLHSAPSFAAQWLSPRLARFLRDHPGVEVRLAAVRRGLAASLLYGVAVTLTNPLTVLFWSGVFGRLVLAGRFASPLSLAAFGLGCVTATLSALTVVSLLAGQARRFFSPVVRVWANRAAGLFLVAFACKMVLDLL